MLRIKKKRKEVERSTGVVFCVEVQDTLLFSCVLHPGDMEPRGTRAYLIILCTKIIHKINNVLSYVGNWKKKKKGIVVFLWFSEDYCFSLLYGLSL
jgi:hypothetical protein